MAKPKGSSDRDKWNKVFNAVVRMLRTQQTQLESLAKNRKLLEDRIKLQYDRWVSDVNLFQDQITQMKNEFMVQEMQHLVEVAKADLVMGMKQREAFVYKHKFENADSELADFRDCFDYLSQKCSGQKDIKMSTSNEKEDPREYLESELRRLQCENDKLAMDMKSEISALLAEKKFIWNQYNRMEKDLNEQLRQKQGEIECANDKIHSLVASMEELQSSNAEKDQMLLTLKNDVAKLKSDSAKKDEEISRLSMGIEASRKSRDVLVTPVLRQCSAEAGSSQSKGKKRKMEGRTTTVKKELDSSHCIEKGCRSSKRKGVEISDTFPNTSRLFTSSFKVPKLKSSSRVN